MLNSEQYIGVKRIVADIVHGAFTGALSVITAMVMTIRRFILTILTIGKRPATVSAFYKTGENLGSAIFLLSSAGSNLLLHMIENIFGNDRFMCILDTKPFFLWLADFLFVLVRNVGLLVVDADKFYFFSFTFSGPPSHSYCLVPRLCCGGMCEKVGGGGAGQAGGGIPSISLWAKLAAPEP